MIVPILITPDYLVEIEDGAIDILILVEHRCKEDGENLFNFAERWEIYSLRDWFLMG